MRTFLTIVFLHLLCAPLSLTAQQTEEPAQTEVTTLLTEFDSEYEEKIRAVALKIYYSRTSETKALPVIIMSHGLGGSREVGGYLGSHWAANGFVVVAIQHAGSDIEIIKGKQKKEYLKAFKDAMSIKNFMNRIHDVDATIDQITVWNKTKAHPLYGMLNLEQIGMCGHSFGAVTTQAVSGQSFPVVDQKYTDKRIKAAFSMSPSSSRAKLKPEKNAEDKSFGKVQIPWLLMTGTKDKSFLTPHVGVDNRTLVYKGLPDGDKYQLVLDEATHMAFSDRTLGGGKHRNPQHHLAIKAISTAFFKAYLVADKKAENWLKSDAVRKQLNTKDVWEKK